MLIIFAGKMPAADGNHNERAHSMIRWNFTCIPNEVIVGLHFTTFNNQSIKTLFHWKNSNQLYHPEFNFVAMATASHLEFKIMNMWRLLYECLWLRLRYEDREKLSVFYRNWSANVASPWMNPWSKLLWGVVYRNFFI